MILSAIILGKHLRKAKTWEVGNPTIEHYRQQPHQQKLTIRERWVDAITYAENSENSGGNNAGNLLMSFHEINYSSEIVATRHLTQCWEQVTVWGLFSTAIHSLVRNLWRTETLVKRSLFTLPCSAMSARLPVLLVFSSWKQISALTTPSHPASWHQWSSSSVWALCCKSLAPPTCHRYVSILMRRERSNFSLTTHRTRKPSVQEIGT